MSHNPLQPMAVNCALCAFAVEIRDPVNIGQKAIQCRRNPPQVIAVLTPQGSAIATAWPQVKQTDSCGEYAPDFEGPMAEGLPGAGFDEDGEEPKIILA